MVAGVVRVPPDPPGTETSIEPPYVAGTYVAGGTVDSFYYVSFATTPQPGDMIFVFGSTPRGDMVWKPPGAGIYYDSSTGSTTWVYQWIENADSSYLQLATKVCSTGESNSYPFYWTGSWDYSCIIALLVRNVFNGIDHQSAGTGSSTAAITTTRTFSTVMLAATQYNTGLNFVSGTPTVLQTFPPRNPLVVGYYNTATTAIPSYGFTGIDGTIPLAVVAAN